MMKETDPNKGVIVILIVIIIILIIILISTIINKNKENKILEENLANDVQAVAISQTENIVEIKSSPNEIQILPTILDTIYDNSVWCGTFQLVWNDMLDELAKDGKIENTQIEFVDNLNIRSFIEDDLSSDYYYKTYGLKTKKLKTEIEKDIKKKFKETSNILDNIDWSDEALDNSSNGETARYLFYVMLKREFEFDKKFTDLENGTFGTTENIKYFGINDETSQEVRNQVEVLYYNSESDYAVSITSKDDDQVILVKNANGETFEKIYEDVNSKAAQFVGEKTFGEEDTLKVPNLSFNILKTYDELIGLNFETQTGTESTIENALQSIEFELDSTGGKVKSEAILGVNNAAIVEEEIREFNFDSEFTIFLKEELKDKPYFAANISNITLFQE